MLRLLGRLFCAMHGHPEAMMVCDGQQVLLRCSCGYETTGWVTGEKPKARATPTTAPVPSLQNQVINAR